MAGDFFYEYFVRPIDEHTGYNPVNTITYAAIALISAYLILKLLKREKVAISERFVLSVIPFVLFGSSFRVLVDAGVLPYNYVTVTPGIYIWVGLLTLASVLLFNRMKRLDLLPYFGGALFFVAFLFAIPHFRFFDYFTFVALLALTGAAFGNVAFNQVGLPRSWANLLVVFAHSLDGAATWVTIDMFGPMIGRAYFEQHVVTNIIAQFFGGFWAFYLIKVLFAIAAVYLLETSDDVKKEDKNYILLLLIIFGLAPGVRDSLRMLSGV